MSIKATDEVIKQRNAHARSRGTFRSQGIRHRRPAIQQPIMAPATPVPAITWDDAMVVHSHLRKWLYPSDEQKREWQQGPENMPLFERWKFVSFRETPGLVAAAEDFQSVSPEKVAGGWWPLVQKLGKGELFPRSEELWGYGVRMAIERDSADPLPSWDSIAVESVADAINELPETLRDAAKGAMDAVTPNVQPWADLVGKLVWLTGAAILGYVVVKKVK